MLLDVDVSFFLPDCFLVGVDEKGVKACFRETEVLSVKEFKVLPNIFERI
jgi:hypothetical protein